MLPTGHEGPYSLDALIKRYEQGKISKKTQIWAEGLPGFIAAEEALFIKPAPTPVVTAVTPDHAPLPAVVEEPGLHEAPVVHKKSKPVEEVPPLPLESFSINEGATAPIRRLSPKSPAVVALAGVILLFLFWQFFKSREVFSLHRPGRMSPDLYQRVQSDFKFEGWDKDIFFKEYLATDLSHIWLVTGSFQKCDVEATFNSLPGKLLSLKNEKVSMRSKGKLKGHIVEFSNFDYLSGNKILPGLYEMDVRASGCDWDGFFPKLGNLNSAPDESYIGRTKVVLYPKGAEEFYRILEKLSKKKVEIDQRTEGAEELFWQDLQQKFQTLLAITLQIEQHFIDFIEKDDANFNKNLEPMVDSYTRKFGSVLTNFVVSNEKYFKELNGTHLRNFDSKKNYEPKVRLSSKNIGFESMKIIEVLQGLKNPKRAKLNEVEKDIKLMFKKLKDELNQKIIQVSEDRSR